MPADIFYPYRGPLVYLQVQVTFLVSLLMIELLKSVVQINPCLLH